MSRIRTLFLGTPEIARFCLDSMLKDPHFEIVGVVTQPDRPSGRKMQPKSSPVKQLAEPLGIPLLTPENVSDDGVLHQLQNLKAEAAVVVAFGQILKQKFLDLFPNKVVNLHASLLPHLRGAAPIQRAIMNGDAETGVSLQIVVRKLDAGPVLGVRRFPLTAEMNASDSYHLCQTWGVDLLKVDLMDYLRGNLSPTPQDETLATIAPKIDKREAQIDWSLSATAIHNLVRGLCMGPVACTARAGKILKIHRSRVAQTSKPTLRPGQVLQVTEKSLLVQCGTGSLELLEVQMESRAKVQIEEYLRGYPVKVGEAFGDGHK